MKRIDSSCLGPRDFPRTSWGSKPPDRATLLQTLARRYWRPVRLYIEALTGRRHDEAKDMTQEFFVSLMDGGALAKWAPERGGFRIYLKLLIRHFVDHHRRAQNAQKRGGGAKRLSLEEATVAATDRDEPDKIFDRAWWHALVRLAIDRVRARLGPDAFRLYEAFDLGTGAPTYAEATARFGLSENDVRNRLSRVRAQVREEIRAELGTLSADAAEVQQEWSALFGA